MHAVQLTMLNLVLKEKKMPMRFIMILFDIILCNCDFYPCWVASLRKEEG
jgi:hypothetical protein